MTGCHVRVPVEREWHRAPAGDGALERAVTFYPGYNCADRSMSGHGVHGMEIRWDLRGPRGETWFAVFTEWIPGQLSPGHGLSPEGCQVAARQQPSGAGIGMHSPAPQVDGQLPADGCPLWGTCYGDTAYGASDALAAAFTERGSEAVWADLEARYGRLRRAVE
jgi:hypothetical protein